METEATTDQASGQSVQDRIAAKFGLPTGNQPEQATADDSGGEAAQSAPKDDLFELNFDGETYRVPSKLKDAFMRNEDYTRKTQELADNRRALEQAREIAQQNQLASAFNEAIASEAKELSIIDAYLQQASKVDWANMSTDQILRHKVEVDSIKERRDALNREVEAKRAQFNEQVNSKLKELRGKSRDIASKSIQNFSEETEQAVRKFALAEGLTDAETDNVLMDPRSFRILWKAQQFDNIKAGTNKAAEAATKADRVLKPGGASDNPSARNLEKANFAKAMKSAGNNSSAKARVIEERLGKMFG